MQKRRWTDLLQLLQVGRAPRIDPLHPLAQRSHDLLNVVF